MESLFNREVHPISRNFTNDHEPITVSNEENGEKLYSFVHKHKPQISKRSLRKYFQLGFISVNGKSIVAVTDNNGGILHDIESKRVHAGDRIILIEEWKQIILSSHENDHFRVLFEVDDNISNEEGNNEHTTYAVIEKPVGIESGENSMFHYVCRERLWSGRFYESVIFLYDIEFGISGVIIAFPSIIEQCKWLSQQSNLYLYFTCLICGKVDSPVTTEIHTEPVVTFPWRNYQSLFQSVTDMQIVSTVSASCRSKENISLLTLQVALQLPEDGVDNIQQKCKQYSQDLKQIKRLFKRLNYPIVGHDDHLIKNKGLFFIQNQVQFTSGKGYDGDSNINLNVVTYAIEVPNKLSKVFFKERDLFMQQEHKKELLYSKLCSGCDADTTSDFHENQGLPLEYQTGKAYFCDLLFKVAPPAGIVMIPRKSSETLVRAALDYSQRTNIFDSAFIPGRIHVVDMGTGSGCLLLSIMHYLKSTLANHKLSGIGIDLSADALQIAKQNSNVLQLDCCCEFIEGSFSSIDTWRRGLDLGPDDYNSEVNVLNLIVCNPPYSASMESNRLSKKVKRYEPKLALFADKKDSLKAYRDIAKVLKDISTLLNDKNYMKTILFIELGLGQEHEVRKIFNTLCCEADNAVSVQSRWKILETIDDHKGMQRCLVLMI